MYGAESEGYSIILNTTLWYKKLSDCTESYLIVRTESYIILLKAYLNIKLLQGRNQTGIQQLELVTLIVSKCKFITRLLLSKDNDSS